MKFIAVALFAFVAVAAAQKPDMLAETLRSESVHNPESYEYNYETSNGISQHATGQLKVISKDESAIVGQGDFAWTSPEGTPIRLSYVADEHGYQPVGDVLPVAPAIPEAIVRALRYIAEHPPAKEQ